MVNKILVTGSSSLVGSHFVETFGTKYQLSAIGRRNIFAGSDVLISFKEVDLQIEKMVEDSITASDAEIVVNFAADTNVDECEREKGIIDGLVYNLNAREPQWLAVACARSGKRLFQISTDAVFDGSNGPYSEAQETGPITKELSWYGYSKYMAEKGITEQSNDSCIIRISYPYRANFKLKIDFARNILTLYRNGKLHPLFNDQIFSPTLIDDISAAIDFLIQKDVKGIYHVACRYPTTPYDFGRKLMERFFPNEARHMPESSSVVEFNKSTGKAPRAVRGGLKTDKISNEGFTPKTVEESIVEFYRQMLSSLDLN
jgi:dTDP-4-dehydrorhamnose reductase